MADIEDESGAAIEDESGAAIQDEGPGTYTNTKAGEVTPAGAIGRHYDLNRGTGGSI